MHKCLRIHIYLCTRYKCMHEYISKQDTHSLTHTYTHSLTHSLTHSPSQQPEQFPPWLGSADRRGEHPALRLFGRRGCKCQSFGNIFFFNVYPHLIVLFKKVRLLSFSNMVLQRTFGFGFCCVSVCEWVQKHNFYDRVCEMRIIVQYL